MLINKTDFSGKIITSNICPFHLHENAKTNGVFELIDHNLVFENSSTNKI
jgi:hypothetical protein